MTNPTTPHVNKYRSKIGGSDDERLTTEVFERNKEPISKALFPYLNKITGNALEIGSGTGQHLSYLAKNFPNIPFYKEVDNFFDKKLIDVAIIATPHRSHIDLGKQALKRNINIIIEKPLAVTSMQCREFIEFSKKYDSNFGIMLNQRTNPAGFVL